MKKIKTRFMQLLKSMINHARFKSSTFGLLITVPAVAYRNVEQLGLLRYKHRSFNLKRAPFGLRSVD